MAETRPTARPIRRGRRSRRALIAASLPTIEVSRAELEQGLGVLNCEFARGFVQSTGEARRQVKGGGLKVNDKAVSDEKRLLTLRILPKTV